MLVEKNYKEYLEVLSSNEPAPGGGSVSAMSGGLAVSLLQMVSQLSINKKGLEEYKNLHDKVLNETQQYKDFFIKAVDEDSNAFNLVIEAFKLPKGSNERKHQVQEGYKHAATVPFNVGLKAYELLDYIESVVDYCNESAITDIYVSALQTQACIEGAFANVSINLGSIKDESFVYEYKVKMDEILLKTKERVDILKEKIENKIQ